MEEIVSLIIPFIALAILSVMIDKFTLFLEGLMNKIPRLPDHFEWWIAYAVVLIFSTLVCWQGDFRFFDYLNLYFPNWLDYFMTGLVISGGSAFVRTQFSMIDSIPTAVMSVTSSFTRMFGGKRKTNSTNQINQLPNNIESNNASNFSNDEIYPPAVEYNEEESVDAKRYSDDI